MLSLTSRPVRALLVLIPVVALVAPLAHCQAPATYQVDLAASRVYTKVGSATSLGHVHGVEGRLASGSLTPGHGGELVFDMTSFTADTPTARQRVGLTGTFSDAAKVTANMRGADVLDVNHHSTATLAITEMTPQAGQKPGEPGIYRCAGRFTLHGVTQSLAFAATLEDGPTAGTRRLHGQFAILQTSFGIKPYSALAGLVRVADRLDIWGDLVLVGMAR